MRTLTNALARAFKPADPIRAERAGAARAAKQARALAAQHPIDIERASGGGWLVTCEPFTDRPGYPLEGNHFVSTGHEMLEAVQTYAKACEGLHVANAQGYEAGITRATRHTNPYTGGSPARNAWDAGYEQGAQTRREMAT